MGLRTADEYKLGIRDNRNVYILGKKVIDPTEDPYLKVGVETAALDFHMAHDDKMRDIAVTTDPYTGEDISTYFTIQDHPESVLKRHELVKASSRYADGALPFVKDVGTDILNGLKVVSRLMGNREYEDRLDTYRRYCAHHDLSMAGCVTDVKGDRSKAPHEQSPDYYVRVVDQSKDEIVISGAKAHITAGAYVDELLIIPTRNMGPKDADFVVACAVPANAPGITQICRGSFRYTDPYHFPLAKPRKGHIESLIVFDNVRVPRERIFLLGDWRFAQAAAYAFAAYHRYTAVTYKIPIVEIYGGLAVLAAEANGISKVSHVREKLVNIIKYIETLKALAKAASLEVEDLFNTGLFAPSRLITNMAKLHFASNYHEFIRDIQDIAGGLLVTQPTYQDWENKDLRPYLEKYLGGAEPYDAESRLRVMSALHQCLASDQHGWSEVCTIHAEGSPASQKMMILAEAPLERYKKIAKDILGLSN
jgi:4-hydroxybutyryl-CoA dehydratase/vinylacetyl-CoA-Delta-isomerase